MLIAFAHIIVIDVKVCLFCDGHAGMSQNLTQGVNIHSVHQASFGKVIPQTMGRVFFVQPCPLNVLAEVTFKVAHADGATVFPDREQIITFHISVLVLQPSPESLLRLGREEYSPLPPSLGFFCSQIDTLSVQFKVGH